MDADRTPPDPVRCFGRAVRLKIERLLAGGNGWRGEARTRNRPVDDFRANRAEPGLEPHQTSLDIYEPGMVGQALGLTVEVNRLRQAQCLRAVARDVGQ